MTDVVSGIQEGYHIGFKASLVTLSRTSSNMRSTFKAIGEKRRLQTADQRLQCRPIIY